MGAMLLWGLRGGKSSPLTASLHYNLSFPMDQSTLLIGLVVAEKSNSQLLVPSIYNLIGFYRV